MSVNFNAKEVLQMAEQIERNGSRFYRRAAEGIRDESCRKILLTLAGMEDQHLQTFLGMEQQLTEKEQEPTVFDPEDEQQMYLKAFVDGVVFDTQADPAALLTGKESVDEVFARAIDMEKDSIAFYSGIEPLVGERQGRDRVRKIIGEEMGHVAILASKRLEFRQGAPA